MSLKKLFRIFLGIQFTLGIGLAILTVSLFQSQEKLSKSQDIHFQSYLLADELRQSSDDLTRLARTYVATGNEKYEREYWAVLDIRNGNSPRPVDYNRIYWDFISGTGQKPRPDGAAISLRALMIREGFTDAEFEKLTLSQKYSDELVKTEKIAMNAVKGLFDDGTGNFTVKKEPDRALAIKLMNDDAYHKHKVNIMKPIDEFYAMFAERTAGDVAKYERRSMNLLQSLGVLIIVIMGMFGYSFVIIQRQITERKRAEEALSASEAQYRILFEGINDAVFVHDLDEEGLLGRFLQVNDVTCRRLGYTREELLSLTPRDITIPEEYERIADKRIGLASRGNILVETIHVTKDGLKIPVESNIRRFQYLGKQVALSISRDITERKRAEAYREMGREVLQILNEQGDTQNSIQRVLAALKTRTGFDAMGIRLQDGDDFPYFVQEGFPKDFLLTENTLIERAADGGMCRDKDGNVSLECTCGLVISGKTDPANPLFTPGGSFWTNDSFPLLDLPSDQDPRLHPRNQCIHQGYASVAMVPIRNRDRIVGLIQLNDRRKGRFTIETIELLEGIGSHIGSALLRKQAEEALRESEEKYRTIIEDIEDCYHEVDIKGNFTFFNEPVCKMLGYEREELLGMNNRQYADEENSRKVYQAYSQVYRTGKPVKNFEWQVIRKDGTRRDVEVSISLTWDREGHSTGFRGIARDITDRKRAEEEKRRLEEHLQRADKMESIGTLAGGIAHDFNNLLMSIQGYASLTLLDLDPSDPHYERLKRIEEQVQSGADLTKQLLGFARGGRYEMKPTDMNDILEKSSSMFGRTKKEITIHRKYGKDIRSVAVDRGQIEQVFMNLYVNAWQAMPGGGEIYLETDDVLLNDEHTVPYAIKPGRYVKITVTDTGTGMDEKTKARIFDPFFTTKTMGRGTGLGLAMVYGIIKGHKGMIHVDSEPGHGTTFNIYLPASEKEVVKEKAAARTIAKGTETILMVDDEKMVLEVSKAMLESMGYRVYAAGSGQEAIAVYMEKGKEVDLVILDMIMPGISGGETFDRLREINPDAKVLLSSGYSITGEAQKIMDRGCNGFLQKPFQLSILSGKVREMID